jgi:hypothetical protein
MAPSACPLTVEFRLLLYRVKVYESDIYVVRDGGILTMPKYHGLDLKRDEENGFERSPSCMFGVGKILHAFAWSAFDVSDPLRGKAFRHLEMHFDQVTTRMLHSLHVFQQRLLEMDSIYARDERPPGKVVDLQIEAGMAADSVFSYIAIFIDDIGKAVAKIYDLQQYNLKTYDIRDLDSFNNVKRLMNKLQGCHHNNLNGISPVFNDAAMSTQIWFDLGLKRGQGVRQRIVHYDDMILFAGSKSNDDTEWKAIAYLWGSHGESPPTFPSDIVTVIRDLFTSLFNWMDQLYEVLEAELKSSKLVDDQHWKTYRGGCHGVPVAMTENPFVFPDSYLYLPLCDGSEPFGSVLVRKVFGKVIELDVNFPTDRGRSEELV